MKKLFNVLGDILLEVKQFIKCKYNRLTGISITKYKKRQERKVRMKYKWFYIKMKVFVTVQNMKMSIAMFRYSKVPNFIDKLKGIKHSPTELINKKATYFNIKD